MRLLLTPDRVRSMIDGAKTEKDVELSLRRHKVRYHYDTSAGFLAIRIPCRTGSVLVYRTASRTVPFRVLPAKPGAARPAPIGYPNPVPAFAWDD